LRERHKIMSYDGSVHEPTPAARWNEIQQVEELLVATSYQRRMLDLSMAVSTAIDYSLVSELNPLVWLIISGPPSSGKTTSVGLLKPYKQAVFRDKITAAGLSSGFVNPKTGVTPKGLLVELDGKCLVIRELASLFVGRAKDVQGFLGILQTVFDGGYQSNDGTVGYKEATGRFGIIACGTPELLSSHQTLMSNIGPRFLFFRVPETTREERRELVNARKQVTGGAEKIAALRGLVADHVSQLPPVPTELPASPPEVDRIAEFLVQGRAAARWAPDDTGDKTLIGLSFEDLTRSTAQLHILGLALARVRGRGSIGEDELDDLKRVALSSMPETRARVLDALRDGPKTQIDIQDATQMSQPTVWRAVDALKRADVLVEAEGVVGICKDYAGLVPKPLPLKEKTNSPL
jgi:hypothetical protein